MSEIATVKLFEDSRMYPKAEVLQAMSLKENVLRRAVDKGKLHPTKIGGIRFFGAELNRWIASATK